MLDCEVGKFMHAGIFSIKFSKIGNAFMLEASCIFPPLLILFDDWNIQVELNRLK